MMGLEESGHGAAVAKNMPAACFLARGRVLFFPGTPGMGGNGKKICNYIVCLPVKSPSAFAEGLLRGAPMGLKESLILLDETKGAVAKRTFHG